MALILLGSAWGQNVTTGQIPHYANGKGMYSATITADYTVSTVNGYLYCINGGASSRNVDLPTYTTIEGCVFVIYNNGSTNNLVVRNSTGGTTIATLTPATGGFFCYPRSSSGTCGYIPMSSSGVAAVSLGDSGTIVFGTDSDLTMAFTNGTTTWSMTGKAANGTNITITGSTGAAASTGGSVTATGGAGGSGNAAGGAIALAGGAGGGNLAGGAASLTSGRGGATGAGGNTTVVGGQGGSSSGNGGTSSVVGGAGAAGNANGGNALVTGGAGQGSGTNGAVVLDSGTGGSTTSNNKVDIAPTNGLAVNIGNSGATTTVTGNFAQSGAYTFGTGTGAVSINGDATVANGKTLAVNGTTSGSIKLAPMAVGTGATTIVNQAGTPTITLPSSTCTLPGLSLNNTWTGTQDVQNNITQTGAYTFGTGTGAVSLNGDTTVAAGKNLVLAVGAGYLQCNGATSGAIKIAPIATGTATATIQNQNVSASTITLPSATCTLPGLGLANTWANTNDFQQNITQTGAYTFGTGTGAVSLNGDTTIAAGKLLTMAAGAGYFTINGATSGGIKIAPIATGTALATIQNQNVAASTITLPSATCTLPGIGLNNTWTGTNEFAGVSQTGAATFGTGTGAVSINGEVTVATNKNINLAQGTGYLKINAQTSGSLKVIPLAATAQDITLSTAAQTGGAATASIPNLAGAASEFVMTTTAQTIAGAKTFSSGLINTSGGVTIEAGKCTVVDYGDGAIHKTVVTLTLTGANDIDVADGSDRTVGVKLFTFPEGYIQVLGCVMDSVTITNNVYNANPNDIYYLGVGSADGTNAADADLTGTEQDFIPKTTIDTTGSTDLTEDFHGVMATLAYANNVLDGHTTAKPCYLNVAVPNASQTSATTHDIQGTMTITWINLGDY